MEIQLVTPPILPLGFQFGRGEMQVLHVRIQVRHLDGGREDGTFWKYSGSEYRGVLLSYSYLVAVFSFITIIISHHHHRGHSSPSSWGHQQEWFSPCWPCSDFSTFPLIIHERVCLCHGREELRFTYQKQQHQQQQRPSTSYNTVPLRTSWLPPAAFIFLIHKGTPSWIYKQNPLIKSNCFGDWYRRFSIVCVFFSDVH